MHSYHALTCVSVVVCICIWVHASYTLVQATGGVDRINLGLLCSQDKGGGNKSLCKMMMFRALPPPPRMSMDPQPGKKKNPASITRLPTPWGMRLRRSWDSNYPPSPLRPPEVPRCSRTLMSCDR